MKAFAEKKEMLKHKRPGSIRLSKGRKSCGKKMLKHNRPRSIRLSKGRKSFGKIKKCLCGKGFQV